MSGFSWNIRGFNKPVKHTIVRKGILNHGFQFGALLAMRVKEGMSQRIVTLFLKIGS